MTGVQTCALPISLETLETPDTEDEIDDPSKWEMDYQTCPHCGTKRIILEVFTPKRFINKPDNAIQWKKNNQYENSS